MIRRKWKLVRWNIKTLQYEPPGDIDREQRFWFLNSAERAKERLNSFHYFHGTPWRFNVASREGAPPR